MRKISGKNFRLSRLQTIIYHVTSTYICMHAMILHYVHTYVNMFMYMCTCMYVYKTCILKAVVCDDNVHM